MSPKTTTFLGVAGIAVGLALAATILHASETRGTQTSHVQRSLYVKSPRTAQRLALGFDALASDAIELLADFRSAFADEVLATRIIADLTPSDLAQGETA